VVDDSKARKKQSRHVSATAPSAPKAILSTTVSLRKEGERDQHYKESDRERERQRSVDSAQSPTGEARADDAHNKKRPRERERDQ
jgi:hypothetical protein